MANSLGANTATATRPARTGRRSSNGRITTSNRPSLPNLELVLMHAEACFQHFGARSSSSARARILIARIWSSALLCAVLLTALICSQQNTSAAEGHWVTTWGCGPQLTEPGNLPPAPLANSTLRQFLRTTLGGKLLRVRFSNAYGTSAVTVNSAHVAQSAGTDSAGNGDINTATDTALTFRGAPAVVIPPGEVVLSDPFEFNLPAITNVALSIYFGNISATTISGHPGSRTTSFIKSGNVVTAANMSGASTTAHWYIITGVEVLADASSKTVVTLGDSI